MPESPPQDAASAEAAGPAEFLQPLAEFCTSLSSEHKRPELIGAFHADELAKGRTHDLATAYRQRFDAFTKRPA